MKRGLVKGDDWFTPQIGAVEPELNPWMSTLMEVRIQMDLRCMVVSMIVYGQEVKLKL